MAQRYEVRGKELGGDEFYSDWVEVVKYEDYAALELKVTAALSHLERASEASNLGLQDGYMKMALRALQNGD